MIVILPGLSLAACRKGITIEATDFHVSAPKSPHDVLRLFKPTMVNGNKFYYASELVFEMLKTEMDRYRDECESCPQWASEVR